MADITLVNLNMLFMRYGEEVERRTARSARALYLTGALEGAGFSVDFRDYQCVDSDAPVRHGGLPRFPPRPGPRHRSFVHGEPAALHDPGHAGAPGALSRSKTHPGRRRHEGGRREAAGPLPLDRHHLPGRGRTDRARTCCARSAMAAIWPRSPDSPSARTDTSRTRPPDRGSPTSTPSPFPPLKSRPRALPGLRHDDQPRLPLPLHVLLCGPGLEPRKPLPQPAEYRGRDGVPPPPSGRDLFLFQDEFFVSGKRQVMEFCAVKCRGLNVQWKAFGRVNLIDEEMMRAMADSGCLELRFGIESGSDRMLQQIKKGFTAAETVEVVPKAVEIFNRVDAFFVWGFPFETMEDFHQSLFQMVAFRMLGARILPSLLSLLAADGDLCQWAQRAELEFCPFLLPEFVFTGHEVCRGGRIELPQRYGDYFALITKNPDIFPGSSTSTWRATCFRSWPCSASSASIPSQSRRPRAPRTQGRRRVASAIHRRSSRRSWRRGRGGKRVISNSCSAAWLLAGFADPKWHVQRVRCYRRKE